MICYSIVFLIISYSFIEQIHSVSSDNVDDSENDNINVENPTVEDSAVPIEGSVSFGGQANASGRVTIQGTTGPAYPAWDYGMPPFYMPPIDHGHMVPTFAPIPYGGPMFGHASGPMPQPHIIEIFDPAFSPMMSQPQFIEIFDPMTGQPQLIEIVEPGFGMEPIFEPFYSAYAPFGPQHSNIDMIPVFLDFDMSNPMFGQVLEESGSTMDYKNNMPTKDDAHLVPVSGKVTILGKF
ncbi:uncharacterized protein LOC119189705 isoform X2 [Manduca sexta]|uniref:uncharacterized protein LOC119189705 isoform X2 n=1 Tax=Manduca sexta TaxID=7130 RepID=UPI00188E4512|nr:uncharacterized protein LOC119189705 isoform X2 [Manduca sexta]